MKLVAQELKKEKKKGLSREIEENNFVKLAWFQNVPAVCIYTHICFR